MPRAVQITVPSTQSEGLIEQIRQLQGLIGLRVQHRISLKPPGDLISLEVTNAALHELMQLLDHHGVGRNPGTSFTTSTPAGTVSSEFAEHIANDRSEWTWEEMELEIGRESNMTANGLLVMAISGIIAANGIATGAIHIVIGAMVIAPGFEPITRIGLGIASSSRGWRRGLRHTALAYLTLALAAAATTLLLRILDKPVLGGPGTYLSPGALVSYWTSISLPSLIVTIAASVGGAILIAAGRAILTAGVMIALALIPAAAITGMAMASGEWALSGKAAMRWIIEAACVCILAALVFAWKRFSVQRRGAML